MLHSGAVSGVISKRALTGSLFYYIMLTSVFLFLLQNMQAGYEKVCCLRCIQPKDTNFGTTCVCRVPKDRLEDGKVVECIHCGCRGCSSGSGAASSSKGAVSVTSGSN